MHNTLERRLSIEETYALAITARRKSSLESVRNDLRQKVGHAKVLGALENVIRSSPPPSPRQFSTTPAPLTKHISWSQEEVTKRYRPEDRMLEDTDEYGFAYEDGEEDFDDMSLCRTESRR